jgi:small-conductance mechanosensitive channel
MELPSLADPITQFVLLMLIAVIVRFAAPDRRAVKFGLNVAFFVALSALLIFNGIEPYSSAPSSDDIYRRMFLGLAKTIWWLVGAMMLVSSVRLFLIFEQRPREGRLVQDLLAGIIYVGAGLSIVAYVFSVPVGTLIATSGVFAVILGLALQSTLADVFSGVALNLGRPYAVGDWIVLESGLQGKVVETNWRATHLLNGTNDLVVIPNSALAKAQLVNLSSPDESHGITIKVRVEPTHPPAVIEDIMRNVLISSNCILRSPAPSVAITGLDGQSIEIDLSCRILSISQTLAAKNEIYDLIYRHMQAAGVPLAQPEGAAPRSTSDTSSAQADQHSTAWRLLNAIPLFSTLTADEREVLAASMVRRTYKKGTVIIAQGTKSLSLMLLRSGVVVIDRDDENGRQIELNRLAPGDFFGERGVLVDAEEPGTIRALTFVVVYEIAQQHLAGILKDRPAMAEELGVTLARRLDSEKHLAGSGTLAGRQPDTLAGRIRHLFQLQHGNDV